MISFTFFFIIVLVLCLPRFGKRFVHLFLFSLLITLQRYELFTKNMFYNIKILLFLPEFVSKRPVLPSGYYKNMTIFAWKSF